MAIKQLSRQLANQIAAGEVVENPASVVKELLENAVDAHATSITLELHAAGKNYIKVSDNGQGIPRDELPLALAPHATSKISTVDDLAAIMTLGFRGEALASIAAVSKLTLTSNTAGQSNGFQVEVAGADQHPLIAPAAHPLGTSVVVRELFFNTPARRRFLKSDRYEFNKVRDIFVRIALVNYGIEFKLFNEGKLVIHAPATDKAGIAQRIVRLLGNDFRQDTINVDNHDPVFQLAMQRVYEADAFGMSVDFRAHPVDVSSTFNLQEPPHQPVLGIHGILLRPQIARRAVPDKVVFFLNGRCMGDKLVLRAIREGFLQALNAKHNLKPSVRGVLFMDCDPHIVDVNVHPRKDEVRFHNSNVIFDCISTTIKTALLLQGVTAQSLGQGRFQLEFDAADDAQGDEQPLFRDAAADNNSSLGTAVPVTAPAATSRMFPDRESCAALASATTTTATTAPSTATTTTTAMGTACSRDMTCAGGDALSGRGAYRGMGTISEDNGGAKRAWAADSALTVQGATLGTADSQALAAASFTRGEQRVARLRQTVEQYLQKTQHGVFSSAKTWAQPTMRGALTDFTQLKAGWDEMEVQRQAQQAVRDELINPQEVPSAKSVPALATTPAGASFAAQTAAQGQQGATTASPSAPAEFGAPAQFGAQEQLGAHVLQNQPSELELQGLQGRLGQSYHREATQSAVNSAWGSRLSSRLSQQEQQRSAEHWQQGAGAVQGAAAAAADTSPADTYGQSGFSSPVGQSPASQQDAQEEGADTRDLGKESPEWGANPNPNLNPNPNPEVAFTQKSIGAEQGAKATYAAAADIEDDADESEEQREFGRQVVDKANLLAQNIKLLKKARLARLSPFERQQYKLGLVQEESAQFLSLVAPNVLLFALRHRYFLAKGSDILTGCLASDYQEQVHEDEVLSYDLGIPFSFAAAKELLAAFKKEEVRAAARRCGFTLQAQPARGMIAIMRAPLLLQGINLAQVLPRALHLVAAGTNSINGQAGLASGFASLDSLVEADDKQRAEAQAQGNVAATQVTPTFTLVASYVTPEQGGGAIGINGSHCPQQLALLLAGMRECEINTEMDARTLLAQLFRLEQLRPLLDRGLLQELNLAQLAQQMVNYKA